MLGSHSLRWLVFFVCGAFAALGCSTDIEQGDSASGSLSLDLVLADGVEIDEVAWQITGNDMDMSGDIDVSAPGSTASVEVFGLPPGDEDYTVMLTATSTDGEVTCKGSAPFNVEIGESTDVMVMLNCKKPRTLGGVRVNGEFNICAQLTKVVVSPLQTSVGNDITLMSEAFDDEGDTITYVWSGDGGSIADPSVANTTYTCQEVGEHSVTILVTDNDVYCKMATWTVPVTCVEGDGGDLCEGVTCEGDGNECTDTECNPANGECETSNVDDGTECDGGTCSSGQCVESDLCDGIDCDDSNECTNDLCNPLNGECGYLPVDNGTDCNGTDGMCLDGNCVDIVSKCDGVICDDTGNECTVAMCNLETGECDTMDVPDGTECDGGDGVCSDGACVDNNLCDGVTCPSGNDCVQDGNCDPSSGECIPGEAEPADTPCGNDGVCDGSGNCGECNTADQCKGGDDCNEATCDANTCGVEPAMDGEVCNLAGENGICEGGKCVEAPACTTPGDCDDNNICTSQDCIGGECAYTPNDGAACDTGGGLPGSCKDGDCIGLCDGNNCTSNNDCVQDGECDDQSGDCVPGANEPVGTPCDQDGGTACDGAGKCVGAMPDDCGTTSGTVQLGCTNGVTSAQSPFPNQMTVTVNEPVFGGAPFTADISGIGAFPKFFLDAAQSTVPGGVRSAIIEGFNTTATAENGTGNILLQANPAGITPGLTQFCQYPSSRVCTADGDCIVPPCNTAVLVANVPISEDCSSGGFCSTIGQGPDDGASAQCNITASPSFCVTSDLLIPLYAPGGPQVMTAGASGGVKFNWIVDPSTITCPAASGQAPGCINGDAGTVPDGAYILPPSIYGDPVGNPASVGPNGIRLNVAGALFVALQCSGGQDGGACSVTTDQGCLADGDCPGGETCVGVGADDDIIMPTDLSTVPTGCPIN